jgi:hypothetical protein
VALLDLLEHRVARFTPEGKIRHLDLYEQAKDSGDWIKDAAKDAMA